MPSSSSRPTRRRLLRSAAALVGAGAVAGCGGTAESSSTASNAPDPDPPDDAVTDPAHVVLRSSPDGAVVYEPSATEDGSDSAEDPTAQVDDWRHHLVADAETATSLSIADVDGAAAARQFLDETDFESESVYVERHVVGECYEQRLCWVRWRDDRVETNYARLLRDADVACSADARDAVTHLIRLPVALDPEAVRRYSSSSGGGRCRRGTDAATATDGDGS